MLRNNTLDYINSFINFEKIPRYQYASAFKLDRMKAILSELGNPQDSLNILHVAGSKGKGSTCAAMAYILKEAGYKAGLYTSPHLVDFKERIRILNGSRLKAQGSSRFEGMISEREMDRVLEEIKPVAEKFREHGQFGNTSFFEILTACAFLYFRKKQVDAAILETGLGGRLDATNAAMSLVCGITNISLEHTDKLGDTLAKIAQEKAGIIKGEGWRVKGEGVVVSASQEKEAMDVIRKSAEDRNAKLYEVGKDIKYSIVSSNESRQIFDIKGPGYEYKNLELNLIGSHQVENACLAMGMLKALGHDRFEITEDNIREGLKKTKWPGRMEIAQKDPYVILDGAQNPASMKALVSSVKKLFKYKKLITIFGISSDKDIRGVSSILEASSDIIILTKAKDNPRAFGVEGLRENFTRRDIDIYESENVYFAIQHAFRLADKEDIVLITGSLFLVGDALQQFDTPCIAQSVKLAPGS